MKPHRPIGRWLQDFLPGKRKISLKLARQRSDEAVRQCALAKLDAECAVARLRMRDNPGT